MLTKKDYSYKAIILVASESEEKLRFANENLVLEDKETGKIKNQMPCTKIFAVFILGQTSITTVLLEKSAKFGFSLIFLKRNFRPYAFMGALTEGNTLLRMKQYKKEEDYALSMHLVRNKITNQMQCLKNIRDKDDLIKESIEKLENFLLDLDKCQSNSELLGCEGNASKIFFKAYFKSCSWKSRKPRVKQDPINTLLDIGYTFLFNFIETHLRLYGFDVYIGVYHRKFYQRKSLVCDLIEPFRCIIDKEMRKNFNLKRFKEEDFICSKEQYLLRKNKNKEYTKILLKVILDYKIDIFAYIRKYYLAFIRDKATNEFPIFTLE